MIATHRYVIDGQSLSYAPLYNPSWPDRFMKGREYAERFSVGIGGTSFAQREVTAATRVDPYLTPVDRPVTYMVDGGTGDLFGNLTDSQIIADVKICCDARRAAGADRCYASTIPPTNLYTAPQEAVRVLYNSRIVAAPSLIGCDAVINIASIPQLANPNDLTYYYDGVHYTNVGAQLVCDKWKAFFGFV